jgi:hypothetical protein
MHRFITPIGLLLFLVIFIMGTGHCKETTKKYNPPIKITEIQRNGRWYMSSDGHAVYCTGPVVKIGGLFWDLQYYATGCLGKSSTVKLHD